MYQTTTANPSSGVIILQGSENYLEWIYTIEMASRKVWKYINPARTSQEIAATPIGSTPRMPLPSDVRDGVQRISQLTAGPEMEEYKMMMLSWREAKADFGEIERELNMIQGKVLGSISEKLLPQLKGKSTVADILLYLNQRYRPSDQARRQQVIMQWNKLKERPSDRGTYAWLDQWELVYADAKELNLPHVISPQAQLDFLHAIRQIDLAWATTKLVIIDEAISDGGAVPDLHKLIEKFRHNLKLAEILTPASATATGGSNSSSVFSASHQEEEPSSGAHKNRTPDGKRTCLCGAQHDFEACFYINFKNRPAPDGWVYKKEIFDKINKTLSLPYRQNIRKLVEKKFGYTKNSTPSEALSKNSGCSSQDTSRRNNSTLGTFIALHSKEHQEVTASFMVDSRSYHLKDFWVLDGGTDIHVCNDESKHEFTRTSEETNGHTIIAGKTEYPIEAWGSTKIKVITDDGYASIILKRTALVPGFMTNLVSLPLITEGGVHWSSRSPLRLERADGSGFCKLFKSGKHIIFNSNLTPVKECVKSVLSANEGSISSKTGKTKRAFTKSFLHRALGHPSREVIDHISEAARDGDIEVLGDKAPRTKDCQTCALTKSHEIISRSSDKEHPASKPFERVTVDLIPMRRGYNSHSQIIHFQCPYTQFNMIFTMVNKSDSLTNTKRVIELIKSMGFRIRFLHLDGETSLQKELDNLALHEGIKVERTAPYTPAQNGHAEISGRWMVVKARAFAIEANLPQSLWPQLIVTVGYIMNRTPSKKLGWKTPFESVYGYKPIFSHLDILGSKVYALKHNIPKLDKLTARAHIGYLVGWESTNIYKVWIPSLDKVINTRDVLIDSGNLYDPHELDAIAIKEPGIEETVQALEWNLESAENNRHLNLNADDLTSFDIPIDLDKEQIISDDEVYKAGEAKNSTSKSTKRKTGICKDINPENIISGTRRTRHGGQFVELTQNSLHQYFLSFNTAKMETGIRHHRDNLPPQPKGWNQMLRHRFAAEFQAAAEKEYRTLESKGTWEHIDDIKDTNLIPLIWIFDYKFDVDGYLVKFKARLCARGDLQYTEDDTYAATLASQSFRAMMAVTAAYDLETRQFDAVNAFVNAPIRDTIYCPTPRGFERERNGIKQILSLKKALYGFKFSALYWYDELIQFLMEQGLFQVPGVNCMVTNDWLTLIFYVDDIMGIYHNKDQWRMDIFEKELMKAFEIRVLGPATHFLGIRIVRDRTTRRLWISQDAYINSFQNTFNLAKVVNPPKTPLPSTPLWIYDGTATAAQIKGYQQKIGKINFAAVTTRADVARAVSLLARYLNNPGPNHLLAADHLLQYLVGTSTLAICYDGRFKDRDSGATKRAFMSFSDASFADDTETRHSSCGFALVLFGGIVHYKSTKQRTVTTSSTESELLAVSMMVKEYMWWIRLFEFIQLDLNQDAIISLDNQQTIRLIRSESPRLVTKLKHIDIHQMWLRQEVQAGKIKVEWISTNEMVADGFTKELGPQKHSAFLNQLGMMDIKDRLIDEDKS